MNIVKFIYSHILQIVTLISTGTFADTEEMVTFVPLLVLITAVEALAINSTSINSFSLALCRCILPQSKSVPQTEIRQKVTKVSEQLSPGKKKYEELALTTRVKFQPTFKNSRKINGHHSET